MIYNTIKNSFRFGIFEILESCVSIKCQHFLPKITGQDNSYYYKALFSHCFNKEKKIKFIDKIIDRTIRQDEPGLQVSFLYLLVIHNDIELVKYYSNKVGGHLQIHSNKEIIPPTYYI
ncbi:hypothetical protein ACTFIR_012060 [Dictyostelium discoideum]